MACRTRRRARCPSTSRSALDGFTLHAATRAGSHHLACREALLRYALRPPLAKDRIETRPDGLVRITLKGAYIDGTIAVDLDPLSLLCRLATSVPPPRFHTVKYAGVLAPASPWRPRIAPELAPAQPVKAVLVDETKRGRGESNYRPWAELCMRTFAVDVLECPRCQGRMRLIARLAPRQPRRARRTTIAPSAKRISVKTAVSAMRSGLNRPGGAATRRVGRLSWRKHRQRLAAGQCRVTCRLARQGRRVAGESRSFSQSGSPATQGRGGHKP